MNRIVKYAPALLLSVCTLQACNNNTDHDAHQTTNVDNTTTDSTPEPSQEWVIEADDQMKFNIKEVYVKAGEPVKITLKHVGKMEKNVMGHNLVVLKMGADPTAFANEAVNFKDNDFIPPSQTASIVAHTKLLGGGESDVIEFVLPEKGTYDYLCSFAGHGSIMKGKIIAE